MEKEILVSVCSLAYNHESYIRQCLDGFVMQKTTFGFEVLINDDASTDHTADIIREYAEKYPDIIKPIYQKENQYSKGVAISATYLYPRAKGKYIAKCEGDDYWTDPYKLQKQVDFMEKNPEYSMCFANAIEHYENGAWKDNIFGKKTKNKEYTGFEVYRKWIPTATTLLKKEIVMSDRFKEISSNKKFIFGDIILFLTCAEFGKLRGMEDCMSVYRRHGGGDTYNKSNEQILKQINHNKELYLVFGNKYKFLAQWYIVEIATINYLLCLLKKNNNAEKNLIKLAFNESPFMFILYCFYIIFIRSWMVFYHRIFFYKNIKIDLQSKNID